MSMMACDGCQRVRDTDATPEGFCKHHGADIFLCEHCIEDIAGLSFSQIARCDAAYASDQVGDDFYFTNGRAKVNRATRAAHVTILEELGIDAPA